MEKEKQAAVASRRTVRVGKFISKNFSGVRPRSGNTNALSAKLRALPKPPTAAKHNNIQSGASQARRTERDDGLGQKVSLIVAMPERQQCRVSADFTLLYETRTSGEKNLSLGKEEKAAVVTAAPSNTAFR